MQRELKVLQIYLQFNFRENAREKAVIQWMNIGMLEDGQICLEITNEK